MKNRGARSCHFICSPRLAAAWCRSPSVDSVAPACARFQSILLVDGKPCCDHGAAPAPAQAPQPQSRGREFSAVLGACFAVVAVPAATVAFAAAQTWTGTVPPLLMS